MDLDSNQVTTSSSDSHITAGEPLVGERVRAKWDNKLQFLLATIGFAVGLGNIWRFPYLCYKNGGGAFLLPYIIMLLIEGIPLLYLELSVGQRLRKGSLKAWYMISPYMGGVGFASVVICFFTATYYSVVIAWFVFYLIQSFTNELPWTTCPKHTIYNTSTSQHMEITIAECQNSNSVLYYFFRETLDASESINDIGSWNWKITLCFIAVWVIIYICVIKGIKTSGKVIYFTATFPYLVLTAFFIRGMTIDGYDRGLRQLFTPKWDKLRDPVVWLEAAGQIFYSTGLGFGCIVAFASYNPVHENTLKDAITISLVNSGTSLFASVVVFSVLGFRATMNMKQCQKQNMDNTDNACDFEKLLKQASSGPGLVFVAFSDAMRNMPAAPLWSILFFLMCLTLGIDSLFGGLESVAASLADLKRFSKIRTEYLSAGICFTCFSLGLFMMQGSANYIVQLFDNFSANISLLVIAICEFVFVTWVYGFDRFSDDIWLMTRSKPGIWWKICWMFVSPCLMIAILILSFVKMASKSLEYSAWLKTGQMVDLEFPFWAVCLGIIMTMSSIIFIPIIAILRVFGIPSYNKEYPPVLSDLSSHCTTQQQTYVINNESTKRDCNQNNGWIKISALRQESYV